MCIGRPHIIVSAREPLDHTGTVGSLHHSRVAPDRLGGQGLSDGASGGAIGRANDTITMHEVTFEESLNLIEAKDPRYRREAYLFVKEALDHTQRMIGKQNRGRLRHVTGQELLAGIRDFALAQYGPMAMTLLEEWGIRKCGDFGNIVFNMVDVGWLARTDKDSRADFEAGYDFIEAFRNPFLPASKVAKAEAVSLHARDN